jgi:hypothetical protein
MIQHPHHPLPFIAFPRFFLIAASDILTHADERTQSNLRQPAPKTALALQNRRFHPGKPKSPNFRTNPFALPDERPARSCFPLRANRVC